jgi:adenosylcobinamide kinase/adenosylcobinamide-phosphate guanylyltransferase
MGQFVLILGGARSGKSDLAERLAVAHGGEEVLYVATGQALDEEMTARIAHHRAVRHAGWRTVEAPLDPAAAIATAEARVVVLDCVTLLVSNLLLTLGDPERGDEPPDEQRAEALVQAQVSALLAAIPEHPGLIIAVSNEVGLGLVPPYPLGRLYRDLLGRANRHLAAAADAAYLVIAGLPIDLKRLSALHDPFADLVHLSP